MSAPAVKVRERPILFSGPMVRAILEGRKTQTRRVVNERWSLEVVSGPFLSGRGAGPRAPTASRGTGSGCGETARLEYSPARNAYMIAFKAGGSTGWGVQVGTEWCELARWSPIPGTGEKATGWRSSIHMPRWASRLLLEITEVRVQRLGAISEEDAEAEGAPFEPGGNEELGVGFRIGFNRLWDSINSKRGYSWESNPWVWAISFRRVEA